MGVLAAPCAAVECMYTLGMPASPSFMEHQLFICSINLEYYTQASSLPNVPFSSFGSTLPK